MNVKTGVDPELDAITEKTFKTTVTKRLKVTPRLVYDLLTKSGFPFELRIEPDAVSWEEGPNVKQGVTRDLERRLLLSHKCDGCRGPAAFVVHGEKRSDVYYSNCEFANVYTCRPPVYSAQATAVDPCPDRQNCPNPDVSVWDLVKQGFAVQVRPLPYVGSEE